MNKGDKKKRIIYSAINGLLGSGVLTSAYCIYIVMVFHEQYQSRFKWIFLCNGILLAAFLLLQGAIAISKVRKRIFSVREIIREGIIVLLLSILWIIPGWYFWDFVDHCFTWFAN